MNTEQLELLANTNRRRIIDMVYEAGVGHVGGSLSVIDMLTAIYDRIDLKDPHRSKVVLSKGHVTPALYACLTEKGIINESEYKTFRQVNSRLQGHPWTVAIPETDATTGLLGQGYSIAVGMAIVKRNRNEPGFVYAICGDGESAEGQIWEALMCANKYKLGNLIFILDDNKLSSGGPTKDVMDLEPFAQKYEAFGIHTITINGNSMKEVVSALNLAESYQKGPVGIIMNTIKGKGVSYMESVGKWHSSGLTDEEYQTAVHELTASREELER